MVEPWGLGLAGVQIAMWLGLHPNDAVGGDFYKGKEIFLHYYGS